MPLLLFDDQQTFTVQDEEVLLDVLSVVVGVGLPGPEHGDVDAELGEPLLGVLERRIGAERAVLPLGVACVEHEPAGTCRFHPVEPPLELGLRDHGVHVVRYLTAANLMSDRQHWTRLRV